MSVEAWARCDRLCWRRSTGGRARGEAGGGGRGGEAGGGGAGAGDGVAGGGCIQRA